MGSPGAHFGSKLGSTKGLKLLLIQKSLKITIIFTVGDILFEKALRKRQ